MADQPLWLRIVYRVERKVGEPVEKVVSSNPYYKTVTVAKRTSRRAVGAAEGISRRGLHLLNLPAGSDIRRVREQLARMDRRLVEIAKEMDDLEAASRAARATRDGAAETEPTKPPAR